MADLNAFLLAIDFMFNGRQFQSVHPEYIKLDLYILFLGLGKDSTCECLLGFVVNLFLIFWGGLAEYDFVHANIFIKK